MDAKFFDDWVEGEEFTTVGRTITESDIVTFAANTGDYNQLHTNAEYMKDSHFGQRIGHGLLGLSICHGLVARTGFLEGSVLAFMGLEDWNFQAPFFIGDTLKVKFKAVMLKASSKNPKRGVMKMYLELLNQDDKVVQSGHKLFMMHRK
jgi:acyl dehydratase